VAADFDAVSRLTEFRLLIRNDLITRWASRPCHHREGGTAEATALTEFTTNAIVDSCG
jgi:hypothetical protein